MTVDVYYGHEKYTVIYTIELSGLEVAHTVVAGRRIVSLRELRTGVTKTPDLGGKELPNTPLLSMIADSMAATHSSFSRDATAIKTACWTPDIECCSTDIECCSTENMRCWCLDGDM